MTAAERTLADAKAAYEADRPLTAAEFQDVRDKINDPATDPLIRGGLKELGTLLDRQSAARLERARIAREQEQARQYQEKIDARLRRWNELMETDPTAANLYSMAEETRNGPVTARTLLRHLSRKDRRPPPRTFEPELLPEYDRLVW